jgi:hypothetical protein
MFRLGKQSSRNLSFPGKRSFVTQTLGWINPAYRVKLVGGILTGSTIGASSYVAYENSEYKYLCMLKNDEIDFRNIPANKVNQKMCNFIMGKSAGNFIFIPDNFKTPSLCWMAVAHNSKYIRNVPEEKKTDAMFEEIIIHDPDNIKFIPKDRRGWYISMESVRRNPYNIKYIPDSSKTYEMKKICIGFDNELAKYFRGLKLEPPKNEEPVKVTSNRIDTKPLTMGK